MDGNRRWAKALGLAPSEGHTAGFEKVKDVLTWTRESGIRAMILYGLSTENWKRAPAEVAHLLFLFRKLIDELTAELSSEKMRGVRVRFAGDLSRFPRDLQEGMAKLEAATKDASEYVLVLALSYGGRLEIVEAAKKIAQEGGEITEERFAQALWTQGVPDPDLIIRTSGEQRLSNFFPWQSVYSELFFVPMHWPDFSKDDLAHVLSEFQKRKRNFGA